MFKKTYFERGILLIVFAALVAYLLITKTAPASLVDLQTALFNTKNILQKILSLLFLFILFKLLYFLFIELLYEKTTDHHPDRIKSIKSLVRFIWWAVYVIIALTLLINNAGAIITSLGLIGFGLTFALQKPILNFIGWVTIVIKDLYNEGERIQIGDAKGDVKEIQLMNTILRRTITDGDDLDYKIVSIPNELVLTTEVINYSKESNYVLEEIRVSVTYESDYNKAIKLFQSVITNHLKENKKEFKEWKKMERKKIRNMIKTLYKTDEDISKKDEKKKEDLEKQLQEVEELAEHYKPKVRVLMEDSAIILVGRFLTPYKQIMKSKTDINLKFLDAVKQEEDIEIAYPHLEIVYDKKKKK